MIDDCMKMLDELSFEALPWPTHTRAIDMLYPGLDSRCCRHLRNPNREYRIENHEGPDLPIPSNSAGPRVASI
jgi:hypothetical protein